MSTAEATARPGLLRRIYAWTLRNAEGPRAWGALALFAFAESSFFPIPPDAMLIPMCLARPDKAYHFATVCTLTSVAGGILGYAIGYYLYESLGLWLMQLYGYGDKIEAFQQQYQEWGAWIIVLKGLTPIPYKIVTIASGFAHYPIVPFILLSFIARGMRFYLVAFLINRYGERAREIIEKRLGLWTTIAAVVIVVGIVAAVYLF